VHAYQIERIDYFNWSAEQLTMMNVAPLNDATSLAHGANAPDNRPSMNRL
jgi:hypothetical protein